MNGSNKTSELLDLVRNTICSIDNGQKKLSEIIHTCIRIARLRNDFHNLLWLQREIINNENSFERTRVFTEIQFHFPKEEFDQLNAMFLELWMHERPAIDISPKGEINYPKGKILLLSVSGIEIEIEALEKSYSNATTPPGMHPVDTYIVDGEYLKMRSIFQAKIIHYKKILENIKNCVYDFLSLTEKQLLYGKFHSDYFEKNREYVEKRLAQLCPEALKEFVAAILRISESTPEVWAQALLSCRRLLKDLADFLYPSQAEPKLGSDGKPRDLSEEKYVNRL